MKKFNGNKARRTGAICLALSALMGASALVGCGEDSEKLHARLTVDGATRGAEISDDLFGIFLEDINYAGDALNAELIQNKTFGYGESKKAWSDVGNVTTTVISDAEDGICATNREYLHLENAGEGEGGVSNVGFVEGMAIRKDATYTFSVYVRAEAYAGNLVVRLTDGTKEYASAKFRVQSSEDWVKYQTTLTASDSCSKDLTCQVLLDQAGAVDLDVVSLEPDDNINGFRKDLAEALNGLSPRFVRFPGGCVIEGKTLELAYDWKDSIGVDKETGKAVEVTTPVVYEDGTTETETVTGADVARRTGGNIWTTQTDYGIGFYEYFMLCEYLGATAIPIVNCGIACMTQGDGQQYQTEIGSEEFNYYVQSALDLVLYAKGDVNSSDPEEAYWASVRTAMGHAEPFEMDYLGIGNEQWGNAYYEHYEAFRDAFIAAGEENELYRSVELIVGNGCLFTDTEYGTPLARASMYKALKSGKIEKCTDYAIVDEHYYMNYTDFLANADHYDTYSRDETKKYYVFAGEYSANQQADLKGVTYSVIFNSVTAAIAEAAYMTGIERNGDIVKLAAYAPVFGHKVGANNQWAVDMIYYDNTSYLPSCNYYVQQMFSQNQGDYVLNAELTYEKKFEEMATYEIKRSGGAKGKTVDSLYYVASVDENGDIIIKIVNANPDQHVNVAIDLTGVTYDPSVEVTVLQSDSGKTTNKDSIEVAPEKSTMQAGEEFVYRAEKNSLTVLRIHTK